MSATRIGRRLFWGGMLCIWSGTAAAAWPVYFEPAAYYSIPDSDRNAGRDFGLQFTAGYSLSDYWAFEALSESSRYRLNDGSGDVKGIGLSFQTVYTAFPNLPVSPLILGGAGWLHTSTPSTSFDSAVGRGGLGLHWQIPDSNFGVRTDAVVRHDFESKSYNDFVFSLGLTYRLGNPTYHNPKLQTGAVPVVADAVLSPFVGDSQSAIASLPVAASAPVEATFHGVVSKGIATPQDSDGDGIPDASDKCPDTPPNAVVDFDGCIIYMKR